MDAEVEYFRNTLELSNTKVRESDGAACRDRSHRSGRTDHDLAQLFVKAGMSKLLIYKDSIDNIIGYVHGYELFRHPVHPAVMRPVNFMPGHHASG
jgi:putative hemolysin